jgi:hypothetical protein
VSAYEVAREFERIGRVGVAAVDLLISKQPFPAEMREAERKVDTWWQKQIETMPADTATAVLLLCRTAAAAFSQAWIGLDPANPAEFHAEARSWLFGLQIALQSLAGDLPPGEFPTTFPFSAFRSSYDRNAIAVLKMANDYALVRDAYLTFKWGGYEVECPAPDVFRFRDVPNWNGMRDDAVRRIASGLEQEKVNLATPVLRVDGLPALDSKYEGPSSLTFPNVPVAQFVRGWSALEQEFLRDLLKAAPTPKSFQELVSILRQRAHFARETAESFIRLVSFDRKASAALSIFHCPLVPVTGSSYVVMAGAMLMSHVTTCINRLAVHRGQGYDSTSKEIETYYLGLLSDQYSTSDTLVRTNVPYTDHKGVPRDIDLLVYDRLARRVLIAMLKAFIHPDTVEEVVRANEQLAYGIEQAASAREWLTTLSPAKIPELLGLPPGLSVDVIAYAVLGNGFAGSDYLQLEPNIPVVDIQYILRPAFKGQSIFAAIKEYDDKLAVMTAPSATRAELASITLGDVTFEFPAYNPASDNSVV